MAAIEQVPPPEPTAAVSVKMPPFAERDVELWFFQVESQFHTSRIVRDETKFHYVVGCLPIETAVQVRDIIRRGWQDGQYDKLKEQLIARHSLSACEKINLVVEKLELLPEERPSVFFRRLLAAAGEELQFNVVIERYLKKVGHAVSSAITSMTETLLKKFKADGTVDEEIQEMMLSVADSIASREVKPTIAATGKRRSHSTSQPRRHFSAIRQHSRARGRYNSKGAWCRNHFIYRDNAYQCGAPFSCTFKPKNKGRRAPSTSVDYSEN